MFLADKQMAKIIDDGFVVVKLDVQEQPNKKELENPGGMDFMTKWGGEKAGLPFMVILDATGKKLTDSIEKDRDRKELGNIGYPAKPNEVAWFMTMMIDGAPKMTKKDWASMKAWLTEHAPK